MITNDNVFGTGRATPSILFFHLFLKREIVLSIETYTLFRVRNSECNIVLVNLVLLSNEMFGAVSVFKEQKKKKKQMFLESKF